MAELPAEPPAGPVAPGGGQALPELSVGAGARHGRDTDAYVTDGET
ncbi:hypothetical protein ACIBU0_09985 [Streptomyces sp. NPDC049627]